MTTNFQLAAQLTFLPVSIILTLFVAHKLFSNSINFMKDIFHGKEEIAKNTNEMFKIGFYLLNIGLALLINQFYEMADTVDFVEEVSQKLGGFSIYLGVVLFLNLIVFLKGRSHANRNQNQVIY